MKLTKTHQDIIKILIGRSQSTNHAIRCEEIAKDINLSRGTIRNQMQVLKTLKMVKGVSGPKGGYIPTGLAYENLMFSQTDEIPVYLNKRPSGVTLKEIRLKPPNNGILRVMGDIRDFKIGDRINIASKKFILSGRIVGRDDLDNSLLSSIEVVFFTV